MNHGATGHASDFFNNLLGVEDPKLIFFLKNLVWRQFARKVGYREQNFGESYDFALSFAGPEREIAKSIYTLLSEREIVVFYDESEQHRIISRDVEQYLAPIYKSEARYVVPLLSKNYPTRIWTKFESDQFRDRFGKESVIPIRFRDTQPGMFSEEHKYGSLSIDPTLPLLPQIENIADILARRLEEDRASADE